MAAATQTSAGPRAPSAPRPSPSAGPGGRELLVAWLLGLVLAALPVRAGLLHPGTVFSAVDTATVHLPWSAAAGLPEGTRPANPDLSDQGKQFYPFYRWVSRSWREGDPPIWNPLIYAGAPGIANAQSGALDPQVLLLVLLEALGGLGLFHWGFALTAWLRHAVALAGAYALARRLGLSRAPATLAAVTFGLSGYQTLWLNHALGHVPPFLPWVLYFLEGLRDPRRARRHLAVAAAALALALAVLGGHAETAFYVGLAAGLWALGLLPTDRRAALLGLLALALGSAAGAASLLPLTEYLGLSGARLVRELEARHATLDPLSLGATLTLLALGALFVRRLAALARPPTRHPPLRGDLPDLDPVALEGADSRTLGAALPEDPAGGAPRPARPAGPAGAAAPARAWLPAAVGLALAVLGAALLLSRRGLGIHASLALVPDRLGAPGAGGYRGEFNYIEVASAWVAFAGLAFAVAAVLSPVGRLPRRGLVLAIAAVSFLLSIELPGLLELYRFVPVVGLGATVRLASVGSLFVGLLAAEGLELAPRASRWAALLVLAPLIGAALSTPAPPPLDPGVERGAEEDAGLGLVLSPPRVLAGSDAALEGWIAPRPRVDFARLRVTRVGRDGEAEEGTADWLVPLELHASPSAAAPERAPARVAAAPEGARWFRAPLRTSLLPDGTWRFAVELLFADGDVEARRVGVASVRRAVQRRPLTLAFLAAGLAALVLTRPGRGAWLVALLAAAQALDFARGVNPAVPEELVFPPTRTEEVLARELGPHRFFADADVLPANTGLVRGLRHVDGYDAMDVASFDEYRLTFLPDANPVLSWNPRALDLDHPAFRLLGVKLLAMREPFDRPGWELIAGPGAERPAETWIYRASDPLPRAFCVAEILTHDQLGELARRDLSLFDPLRVACLKEDWRPTAPFRTARVDEPRWTNGEVRVHAELDGEGLLVLTDQHFPGWRVWVDGEERELLRADFIFRAVALGPGAHEVVFRYEPGSLRLGAWISGAALAAILVVLAAGLRGARAARVEPAQAPGA